MARIFGEPVGLFITIEGIEGSGKSTQMGLLKGYLEGKGMGVVAIREPGGTPLGERIRSMLLNAEGEGMTPLAELFLYEASRAQLISDVIAPALEAGVAVICDRYTDSTLAYQGYGRGLDKGEIELVNTAATGGLAPALPLLIDLEVEVGLKRAWSRISAKTGLKEDRFEKEEVAFHRRVRQGYLEIAGKEPGRVRVVDGRGEIMSIHADICDIIDKTLG